MIIQVSEAAKKLVFRVSVTYYYPIIPTSSWIQAKIISTLRCCPRRFVCLYNFNIPKADFLVQDTLKIVACDDDGGELKEVTVNLIKEV